jgi:hypothetical protein
LNRVFDDDMRLQQARRYILENPRLSSDWLGAVVFVIVALALLVGALTLTLSDGTGVQSEDVSPLPDSQAAPHAGLELLSSAPTSTPRVIRTPVSNQSNPTPGDKPLSTPTVTPSPQVANAVAPKPQGQTKPFVFRFGAADWHGGYFRGDAEWYGRAWTAVYGAYSPNPSASLTVYLTAVPRVPASLTISGLDDEWSSKNPIVITVNGVEIFSGPSPFGNWDGIGQGEQAVWSQNSFAVPKGLLHEGANDVSVQNLAQSTNFSAPPYLLLSDAILEIDL